ncbi:hypothetical protein KKH07_02915 [Patescibacteria group bacterium]|nr:hypothetical protein [Patescibacteria group bacterium]MBU1563962.1 hypothetical protein [Patescibacteria group bacterium]MBU2068292.1 hypothetical protein [Patescibacteria group bacterium]
MNLKSLFSRKSSSAFSGDKKQQVLISVFVIVVVITLIFLYYNFWRSPSLDPSVLLPGADQNVRLEKVIEKVNFDVEFLKTTHFQDLKLYGEWPLEIPDKGRPNPFLYGN